MTSIDSHATAGAITRWNRLRHLVANKLTWGRVYGATSYIKSALWFVPIVAIALELLTIPLVRILDEWLNLHLAELTVTGAAALYQTVITLTVLRNKSRRADFAVSLLAKNHAIAREYS